ncbi:dehydrogenase/reductase SDR family member on chromosome X homolog [Phodopus roborovskii]|uniref:CAAA01118383.1 protein n=1 Tax=Phodopus roborovskii TaxID=109678 RepID=A0AAV0A2D4_PHORO|nr:dehydrogenase/reductase SDR family member on chromosome X homolog [Phodopus roborovskii]CAH7188672.1 CAAA01118383.1 [Phodopus roborovskii]
MSVLQALRALLLVYAVGAAVILRQLLRRLRGGFRPPVLPWQPDRVALVTGGTEGIGLATAQQLAALGMRVVIAGNDKAKAQEVVSWIQAETKNKRVHFLFCDLASLASVRKFARDFLSLGFPLHVLVNNAGVMMVPPSKTEDGFERHMGVNFLGHFLLTRLLLGVLRASGSPGQRSRVVTLGSATHYVGELDIDTLRARPPHSASAAYAGSKLALVLFSRRLQRLLVARGDPVTSSVADPGVVDTALYRHAGWGIRAAKRLLGWALFKTPAEGAWTSVYAASAPELEGRGGLYLTDEAPAEPLASTQDPELQDRLWAVAESVVGVARDD